MDCEARDADRNGGRSRSSTRKFTRPTQRVAWDSSNIVQEQGRTETWTSREYAERFKNADRILAGFAGLSKSGQAKVGNVLSQQNQKATRNGWLRQRRY